MSNRRKPKEQGPRLDGILDNGIDWKSRTVWIVGELSEEKAYRYLPGIRLLDESVGPIRVVIMSQGGNEGGGFALFDTLQSLKNVVTTYGFGHVYSIAALVFQAGNTRMLAPSCELMMHNGSVTLEGGDVNTDYIEELAAEAIRNNARYHKAIATRSNLDLQKVVQWCKDEKYLSAEAAVAEGLADGLVKDWK